MTNLKRALGTDGILLTHEKAEYHINAAVLANSFITTYENPTLHVDNIIEKCSNEHNLHVLEKIISTIVLLGRHGLPLRGHRDDCVDFSVLQDVNKGNFIALLEHQAITNNILKDHLISAKKKCKIYIKNHSGRNLMKENLTKPFRTGNTKFFFCNC